MALGGSGAAERLELPLKRAPGRPPQLPPGGVDLAPCPAPLGGGPSVPGHRPQGARPRPGAEALAVAVEMKGSDCPVPVTGRARVLGALADQLRDRRRGI